MMHHPNMHHQPMSGHPPQHLPGHQGMPAHHQMPPHQMHRENRHVTLTRVQLGPSQPGGGMGGHGQMGGMGTLPVPPHHAPGQRPPHPIRAMHHPPTQHHTMPQTRLRRPYSVGGGYGPGGGHGVMPPPYAQPPPMPPSTTQQTHTGLGKPTSPKLSTPAKISSEFGLGKPTSPKLSTPANITSEFGVKTVQTSSTTSATEVKEEGTASVGGASVGGTGAGAGPDSDGEKAAGEGEATRPAAAQANSKEKTPMCLVNELARYNKIKHQYRLTSETGPAHKKVFTVTLRLGDTEEYTAEGSSIKRAQHAAAGAALAGTRYPQPPPRATAHSAVHHHRHAGAVMPTVELNALAMKLCQPAVYTSVPAVTAVTPRVRSRLPYRLPATFVPTYPHMPHPAHPARLLEPGPSLLYRVRVCVGGQSWIGEGNTPQAARHDAAARALHELRPAVPHAAPDSDTGDSSTDLLNSEVKSPVSLVHELALKRNLSVQFTVKSEHGPPHMRVFVTVCTVGDMETEGEGNGKKVSKRRAAEQMLEEMRNRWPPALLRPRATDKRRPQPAKKKPRNLIKEGGAGAGGGGEGGADNPISRLAVARHAARARSPQYRVLEERGAARRREFLVQCDAPPHSATGLGPNKKTAKRRAAHNVLLAMEMSVSGDATAASTAANDPTANGTVDANKTTNGDVKRKENEVTNGGASAEVRQPVPGVLMMDFHQRSGQPPKQNGERASEASATGGAGAGGSSPGAKDQLMYLSQLLGFTVQFSDFPKRNHGEYLSLVSLSTKPPVMCHGGGDSTAHSHEQCARAALHALALMGLDAPAPASAPPIQSLPGPGAKPAAISNGITE